jgi:hypothetical protein
VETAEMPEGADAGILQYVLGVVVVAREPTRQIVGGIQMRQHRALELSALA